MNVHALVLEAHDDLARKSKDRKCPGCPLAMTGGHTDAGIRWCPVYERLMELAESVLMLSGPIETGE
jgi:hypothetical protein